MSLQKQKPYRSEQYLRYVASLPCCVTGATPCDAHHITGTKKGGVGTKPGDDYTIPLTRSVHTQLHNDPKRFALLYGSERSHLERILFRARKDGMLDEET